MAGRWAVTWQTVITPSFPRACVVPLRGPVPDTHVEVSVPEHQLRPDVLVLRGHQLEDDVARAFVGAAVVGAR